MESGELTLAVLPEVFPDEKDRPRLADRLLAARARGATLAVLPELPLNRWAPATPEPSDADAEDPGGPRQLAMSRAAAAVGIGLLGGAIVRDADTGERHNTAVLFDENGSELGRYSKVHLPQEEGFWEASHYRPGREWPRPLATCGLRIGVQICSDANRPFGTHLLRMLGAEVVFVPRATPASSYQRWKLALRANALTAGVWVVSINRPGPEAGVPIGSPSLVIAPDGEVMAEIEDDLEVVSLSRSAVEAARRDYPGYLAYEADLYSRALESLRG